MYQSKLPACAIHMYIDTCMYIYIYIIYTYVYIYIYTCVCFSMYIYTYIHTYIHTYIIHMHIIYIYIDTYVYVCIERDVHNVAHYGMLLTVVVQCSKCCFLSYDTICYDTVHSYIGYVYRLVCLMISRYLMMQQDLLVLFFLR